MAVVSLPAYDSSRVRRIHRLFGRGVMPMRRSPRYWRPTIVALVGSVLLVLGQRFFREPAVSLITSWLFLGIVLTCGLLGGWKSGLVATASAVVAALFFFAPSYLERISANPTEVLRLLTFALLGVV